MMKNFVLLAAVSILISAGMGCVKDSKPCQEKTIASEEGAMQAFATANGITATRHSSGLYYEIINPGSGPTPTINSTLKVNYVGKFTNGTIFDQNTTGPATITLGGVIVGWQIGLPLVKKGGLIKLIIPSSYAYGCVGRGPIPAYSVLYFEVEIVDVL